MPRFDLRHFAIAAIAASVTLAAAGSAEAGRRHHHGDVIAAGIAGAVLGAIIASPGPVYGAPVYVEPRPIYVEPRSIYVEPAPIYVEPAPIYVEPAPRYDDRYRERQYRSDIPRGYREDRRPPRVVTYEETVGQRRAYAAEPWSQGWYDYCSAKFRSFDPDSGTYLGHDGLRHFCVVR